MLGRPKLLAVTRQNVLTHARVFESIRGLLDQIGGTVVSIMASAWIRPLRGKDKIDRKRVTAYRQMLRAGMRPPPITLDIRLADGRWRLFDGRHRLKQPCSKAAR
jgi:hypothetical protein